MVHVFGGKQGDPTLKVIPFPQKYRPAHWRENSLICDHLMDVAQTVLDNLADQLEDLNRGSDEFREQFIFVLEKLGTIADDLKNPEQKSS